MSLIVSSGLLDAELADERKRSGARVREPGSALRSECSERTKRCTERRTERAASQPAAPQSSQCYAVSGTPPVRTQVCTAAAGLQDALRSFLLMFPASACQSSPPISLSQKVPTSMYLLYFPLSLPSHSPFTFRVIQQSCWYWIQGDSVQPPRLKYPYLLGSNNLDRPKDKRDGACTRVESLR